MNDAYRKGYDRIDWSKPLPPLPDKPRAASKRANFPTPMIDKPFAEDVQSMADGKYYGDKAGLYASYRAENNPQGENYVVLGDREVKGYTPQIPTREERKAQRAETILRAEQKVLSGQA